jgi:predicted molibdopterin-dependent oxidoreductase YjgC
MILWGMGVSQHVHGTDNARCLIALCAVTGQIGKPGSGLHPLRGQNNVQGASDAGLIPMMFPNYQRVDNPAAHAWFEEFWGCRWTTRRATPWSRSCTRRWPPTATRTRCAACTSWARTRP